jgi:hypothetical protein
MPVYTVEDTTTGRRVKFEWNGDGQPTDADMEEVFASAGLREQPAEAQPASGPVQPSTQFGLGPIEGETSREQMQRLGQVTGADISPIIKEAAEADYVRPMLETGGMVGGAAIGAAGGPATAVVGGGLGYAGGAQLADIYEQYVKGEEMPPETPLQTVGKTVGRVGTGAAYEAGGQAVATILGRGILAGRKGWQWAKAKFPRFSLKGVETAAGRQLVASTSMGDMYAQNVKEAEALEQAIPGLRFTRGQRTGDPKAIKAERAALRSPGEAAPIEAELRASNSEALQAYLKKTFPQAENLDDVLGLLKQQSEGIEANIKGARALVGELTEQAAKREPQDVVGSAVREAIKTRKAAVKEVVGEKFAAIPDQPVPVKSLRVELHKIKKGFDPDLDAPADMPSDIINGILKKIKATVSKTPKVGVMTKVPEAAPDTALFSDLRKANTRVKSAIRNEYGSPSPNDQRLRRLNQVRDALDNTFTSLEESNAAYRAAAQAYREQYVVPFKQGTVPKTIARDKTGAYSLSNVEAASRFWTAGTRGKEKAAELVKALGPQKSKELMRDYASQDMLNSAVNPSTGEIVPGKLKGWLTKYRQSLKAYGLTDEFKDVAAASRKLEQALEMQDLFNKTAISKALAADPEVALKTMLTGPGSVATKMKSVMKAISGNKQAVKGLQDEFSHMMLREAQNTGVDIRGNPLISVAKMEKLFQKYAPAMRELYKNEPGKLRALMQARKAYRVMERNIRSPIGGGSDTAENIAAQMASLSGPLLTSRYALVNAIRMIGKGASKFENEQIAILLNKAMIDPKTAERLMAIGKGKVPEKAIISEVDKLMSSLMFYGVNERRGNEQRGGEE